MGILGTVSFVGFLLFLSSLSIPSIYYYKIKNNSSMLDIPIFNKIFPSLTILLPVRNESILIEKKLIEILNMEYPLSKITLLIIESGSNDNTSEIIKNFFNKDIDFFDNIEDFIPPSVLIN